MLEIQCSCGKRYQIPDHLAGKKLRCKQCQATLTAPAPASAPPPRDEYDFLNPPPQEPPQSELRQRIGGVNPRSVASNQGRLSVNFIRYYSAYPLIPIIVLLALMAGTVGIFLGDKHIVWGVIVLLAALFTLGRDILSVRTKFNVGDVCPAIVLERNRIAVWTDLSADGGYCPVIFIIKAPLSRAVGGPPDVGTRIPTISLYEGPPDNDGAWRFFDPDVIACATSDPQAVEAALRSIPEESWTALEKGLASLGPNPKSKLHRLY